MTKYMLGPHGRLSSYFCTARLINPYYVVGFNAAKENRLPGCHTRRRKTDVSTLAPFDFQGLRYCVTVLLCVHANSCAYCSASVRA